MSFDIETKMFRFIFKLNPEITTPLEIFVPEYQYTDGFQLDASGGEYDFDEKRQKVLYFPDHSEKIHQIQISPK